MAPTRVSVNPKIFPLSTIKSALYVLSDRMDGRLDEEVNGKITVILTPIPGKMTCDEVERAFNQALIAASVNEHAFQTASPIRNYLAQSALSILTQNQQTIQEFVASVIGAQGEKYDGAPVQPADALSTEEDDLFTSTEAGNMLLIDEADGQIIMRINTYKYLLPELLWAAHETRDICDCAINNLPNSRLIVQLRPRQDDMELDVLRKTFEYWLEVAEEHLQ